MQALDDHIFTMLVGVSIRIMLVFLKHLFDNIITRRVICKIILALSQNSLMIKKITLPYHLFHHQMCWMVLELGSGYSGQVGLFRGTASTL